MKFLWPGGGVDNMYGYITAPNHKGIPAGIVSGSPWAGDLGCLSGPEYVKRIDFDAVANWLPTMAPYRASCLFLAGGDIVGNAQDTLDSYAEFSRYFSGWPLAYVAQDGAESLPIPADCAAVFIGGSTEWKCSREAVSVIIRAQKSGKHIHIGRVNWGQRYDLFRGLPGSDLFTCDGTRPAYEGRDRAMLAWKEYEKRPYTWRLL